MTPKKLRVNWLQEHAYYHRAEWVRANKGIFHETGLDEIGNSTVVSNCKFDGVQLVADRFDSMEDLIRHRNKIKLEIEIYRLELLKSKLSERIAKQSMVKKL